MRSEEQRISPQPTNESDCDRGVDQHEQLGSVEIPLDKTTLEKGILYREKKAEGKRYELRKEIGGLTYVFVLFPSWDAYKILFKTVEHDYAITAGTMENVDEIFSTLKEMVDVARSEEPTITKIHIEPATHEYGVAEIEACKAAMLEHDPNLTKVELDELEGFEVLSRYRYQEELGDFPLKRGGDVRRGEHTHRPRESRSRLFRIYFKKYFSGWKIEQSPRSDDFTLVLSETV